MARPLDERCEQLAFLLGRWRGNGSGIVPGRDAFPFEIDIAFDHLGSSYLTYRQSTQHPDGRPSHQETGFLRCQGSVCELVVSQSGGRCEVAGGTAKGGTLTLITQQIIGTPTAHMVTAVRRKFAVKRDELFYELMVSFAGEASGRHIWAELHRS